MAKLNLQGLKSCEEPTQKIIFKYQLVRGLSEQSHLKFLNKLPKGTRISFCGYSSSSLPPRPGGTNYDK